jgi:hypothetical protein
MITSLRLIGVYLLLLVPVAAIVLPTLRAQAAKVSFHHSSLTSRFYDQTVHYFPRLAVLLLSFAITYTLSMPAILSDFNAHAFIDTISKIVHHGWWGTVLYFGENVFPFLAWHYIYGYMLVKLPLYYHFFLLTILATSILLPRATWQALRDFLLRAESASIIILLLAALIPPLAFVLLVRSVRYDELRHMLFIVPPICMLLYFGFVAVTARMRRLAGVALMVLVAMLCWSEAVIADWSLHPYEYAYYNPLVNPAGGSFELDYWGTSFRELAERLNDYARNGTRGKEKLRLLVCGPPWTLTHFLDPAMFDVLTPTKNPELFTYLSINSSLIPQAVDVLGREVAPQLIVALNRGGCMALVNGRPWLMSVERGNLVFAVVARN